MSLKDLFGEDKDLRSLEPLTKEEIEEEIESFDFAMAAREKNKKFFPLENFNHPEAFARFGSAEKYYEDSIKRIYNTYPYDGSLKEKVLWELSSSYLDLFVLENGYPRTTGYAVFGGTTRTATNMYDGYGANGTGSYQYILVKGGPHPGTGTSTYFDQQEKAVIYRKDANKFDLSNNRENNLKIGGNDGNTVEFWLKKAAFDTTATHKEVILDVFISSSLSSSDDYARLRIELSGHSDATNTLSPFYVTYMSGTSGFFRENIGENLTTSSVTDDKWHHYALRFKNTASNVVTDLFIDGKHNDRIQTGTTVDYVSGALVATIGALGMETSGSKESDQFDYPLRGYGRLSASIDEFRYWKTWRSSKKIQRYWFDQVGAGTNTDPANTHLGVYYKFNEGIVGGEDVDKTVLDYSGRISNGTWTGYDDTFSRETGSAINECGLTNFSGSEFEDPIIYSQHKLVKDFLELKKTSGRIYDDTNSNSLDTFIPQWMLQENETKFKSDEDKNFLFNALQIIASYFDSAAILIDKLPSLSQKKYYSSGSFPPPFNKKLLESSGFIAPDIFVDASLLEQFEDRNDERLYEESLQKIKNTIYQNIYNNVLHIYKTKGTEKSFRNLIRCFGLGDDTLKFNIYANNQEYEIEENSRTVAKTKKYINFNEVENSDGVVFQYKIDDNSTSFISASQNLNQTREGGGMALTQECDVILPNRVTISEWRTVKENHSGSALYDYPLIITASLFGMHTATSTENDLQWPTNDFANFQVYTEKDADKYSSNAKFVLTGSSGGFVPRLESPYFEDVYDDQKWTISVTIKPSTYPMSSQVSGAGDNGYTVQFYGSNHISDYKYQSFLVTGSMTRTQGYKFMSSNKRAYMGAHRTNFTGSVIHGSDVKASSCMVWFTDVATSSIDQHNMKIDNYGLQAPIKQAFLYQDVVKNRDIPYIDTLALKWDFSEVTSSNELGGFNVEDESSGSATDNRFGWFSGLVSRRHTATGSSFAASSFGVSEDLERSTLQAQVPEIMLDSNLTRILSSDDEFFDRDSRPITHHLSVEKNMFQDISEEMLNMFASVKNLNTLIGAPKNKYRARYKDLIKAADIFFENVDNDYDFDKFVEYFKHIDYAVGKHIEKIIPMSMKTFKNGILTIVENYVLGDRNKFRNKAPIIKEKIPKIEGQILGIRELLYDWKHGHAPLATVSSELHNCFWWKERAERTGEVLQSGDSNVDTAKQTMLDASNNDSNALGGEKNDITLYDKASGLQYSASMYVLRALPRPYRVFSDEQNHYHGGINFNHNRRIDYFRNGFRTDLGNDSYVLISSYEGTASCDDVLKPNQKVYRDYSFDGLKDKISSPFNIISASANNSSSAGFYGADMQFQIVDMHYDAYGDNAATPMQGPFTEAHVGGSQHRHQPYNTGDDHVESRPELFRLWLRGGNDLYVLPADTAVGGNLDANLPRAEYYRDEIAKRPVNIRNVQHSTASAILGNYHKDYEIVLTNGRSINNVYTNRNGVIEATSQHTLFSGVFDYTLLDRGRHAHVFVNRFSAPGGPEINGEGCMDIEAGEYSAYNALPWRNFLVRNALNELYSNHCKQYGYYSDTFHSAAHNAMTEEPYPDTDGNVNEHWYYAHAAVSTPSIAAYIDATASFHKVNRNTRMTPVRSAATASFANLLTMTGPPSNNHRFTINVPTAAGGTGTDITFRLVTGAPSDGTANEIQVQLHATTATTVDRVVAAINGATSSVIKYGAGSGDTEHGVRGIVATEGSAPRISISATRSGKAGNDIEFIDVAGTIVAGGAAGGSPAGLQNGSDSMIMPVYDNWFVQHPIPQTDAQYAWITASLVANYNGPALFDYEKKNFARADYASDDLTFQSASDYVSVKIKDATEEDMLHFGVDYNYYVKHKKSHGAASTGEIIDGEYLWTPFNYMITHVQEPVSSSENILGYPGSIDSYLNEDLVHEMVAPQTQNATETLLNAVLLNRNGPYQAANWKLYRKDDHPIVRNQKNHNLIGTTVGSFWYGDFVPKYVQDYIVKNYIEPPLSSKYKPLRMTIPGSNGSDRTTQARAVISYGNQKVLFTDHRQEKGFWKDGTGYSFTDFLTKKDPKNIKLFNATYSPYLAFKTMVEKDNVITDTQVSYAEIVYPKEQFTYLSGSRKRSEYLNDFWRNDRDDRTKTDLPNSMHSPLVELVNRSSIWDMDAHEFFVEKGSRIPYSGTMAGEDGSGELQNAYCLFHFGNRVHISASCNYNRRVNFLATGAITTDFAGITSEFIASSSEVPHTIWPDYPGLTRPGASMRVYSASVGDVLWEASSSANDGTRPFYDSYDDYAEDGFRMMKDGTIVPEFKMSERIGFYADLGSIDDMTEYQNQANFIGKQKKANLGIAVGMLSMTGSDHNSGSDDFLNRYVFSDFYKHFTVIKEDYSPDFSNLTAAQLDSLQNSGVKLDQNISRIKIGCDAIVKFLPYDGFYPAQRTLQLGSLFSSSLSLKDDSLQGTQGNLRTIMQPYFAPGLLYNSIKAGLAVDYPIYTVGSSKTIHKDANLNPTRQFSFFGKSLSGSFNTRLGFESLLEPRLTTYIDSEPIDICALDSTGTIQHVDNRYKMAMSNFLAETMNFFLIDRRPSTIVSNPLADGIVNVVKTDKTHSMDIILRNSKNITSYDDWSNLTSSINPSPAAGTAGCSLTLNTSSVTMYSRAQTGFITDAFLYGSSFGPPVVAGLTGSNNAVYTSFEPFTPPYYDGYSSVRVQRNFTEAAPLIDEAVSDLDFDYSRMATFLYKKEANGALFDNPAQRDAMQISASIDFGQDNSIIFNRESDVLNSENEVTKRLVISPKWECPILDFTDSTVTPSVITGNIARGMWHQYGAIPTQEKGIFMELHSSLNSDSSNHLIDLGQVFGLGTGKNERVVSKKLGRLASSRKFSEAIVAVPFKTISKGPAAVETKLYTMNGPAVAAARKSFFPNNKFIGYQNMDLLPESAPEGADQQIYDLLKNMAKYVLPPHLDFFHNPAIRAHVMYIMEVEVELERDDLQNIWQNIEPTFAKKATKVFSNMITHTLPLNENEKYVARKAGNVYFDDVFDEENTRWAVFKVKRRARNNYHNVVNRVHVRGEGDYIRSDAPDWKINDYTYSYNWPHDFYSLIELCKVTTNTTFNPIYEKGED